MTRTVTITIMMVTHDQRTRQDGSIAPHRHSSRLAESGPAKLEDPGGPGPTDEALRTRQAEQSDQPGTTRTQRPGAGPPSRAFSESRRGLPALSFRVTVTCQVAVSGLRDESRYGLRESLSQHPSGPGRSCSTAAQPWPPWDSTGRHRPLHARSSPRSPASPVEAPPAPAAGVRMLATL
jgi:hypothetical protein